VIKYDATMVPWERKPPNCFDCVADSHNPLNQVFLNGTCDVFRNTEILWCHRDDPGFSSDTFKRYQKISGHMRRLDREGHIKLAFSNGGFNKIHKWHHVLSPWPYQGTQHGSWMVAWEDRDIDRKYHDTSCHSF
jgi:hypothetical protein